ncbi:N-acetyltransferase GCN5 [Deinococcus malanensis]|uniref:N-acetyltransferase GCN5 n=1 Tax=Deinococcus malanensis TaxID=1706855 RepID=A0ABQ2ERN4_9DEIO|nr:GNAT family N-acetyltransferase [Deinococcus malanensis]GGK23148.1 N-acetyltransferase GCN5 [Deinococcus malanensis]
MIRPVQVHDTALGLAALREPRPGSPATASAEALSRHLGQLAAEGYRLVGVFEDEDGPAVTVAGYRTMTTLAGGRTLYLDDLSTLPRFRGRGHAGRLLVWLDAEARRLGSEALHLDSGVGEARFTVHRQYLRHSMGITCHDLEKRLP